MAREVCFELQLGDDIKLGEAGLLERRARAMVVASSSQEGLDEPLEVCLRLTSDAEVRGLNRDYRRVDVATDVLAFALREAPGGEAAPHLLGDIVISVECAERQREGRSLAEELELLFAHGLCHLLGYDHRSDREEAEMNARVDSLLAACGSRARAGS